VGKSGSGWGEVHEARSRLILKRDPLRLFMGPFVQRIQYFLQNLVWIQVIRIDYYMSVFPGMHEPVGLFFVINFPPIQFSPRRTDRKGCVEINQNIRPGNDLPHVLHMGMLLCNMAAGIAEFFKACDKG
jgi:hypothetical protein